MDQLRQTIALIQAQLGRLSASQKMLIGSVAVILMMTLIMVSAYAGRPDMVEILPGATGDQVNRAATVLTGAGVRNENRNGRLMVPVAAQTLAVSRLEEQRAMPQDSRRLLFDNLIENQSWTKSKEQNEQLFNIATQNQLAMFIGGFSDVRSAEVIMDVPAGTGLGRAHRTPTASVTVFTESGAPLSQAKVDAIADMVAGSRAGLKSEYVRVIDGTSGRSRRPSDPDTAMGSDFFERAARVEQQVRTKLLEQVLSHIPGVQVAVTANVDVTRVQTQTETYLPEGAGTQNLIKSETSTSQSSTQQRAAAEPGVRSNTTADINRGPGAGTRQDSSDSTTEFAAFPGVERKSVVDPRGMPTMMAVSVNIPKSYVEGLIRASKAPDREAAGGEEATDPTQEELDLKFEEILPAIRDSIRPHVAALTAAGGLSREEVDQQISVAMTPVRWEPPAGAARAGLLGTLGGGGGSGGGMFGVGGSLLDRAVMVVLAMMAMGMMFMLVRKASKQTELPSAQELVGVPPALENVGDLIGEADETDTPLEGIEIDELHVQKTKMLDQVGELVTSDPQTAARLLNRWITIEE